MFQQQPSTRNEAMSEIMCKVESRRGDVDKEPKSPTNI